MNGRKTDATAAPAPDNSVAPRRIRLGHRPVAGSPGGRPAIPAQAASVSAAWRLSRKLVPIRQARSKALAMAVACATPWPTMS